MNDGESQPPANDRLKGTTTLEERAGSPLFQTKTDAAFAFLLRAITYGDLKPGDRILAGEWSAKAGVSQIPLREALRRLEAQKLVRVDPHRGASVLVRGHEEYEEVYLIRKSLETLAARQVIVRSTPSELTNLISTLERDIEEQDKALQMRDWRRVHSLGRAMHMMFYRASKLPHLIELIESQMVAYAFNVARLPRTVPDDIVHIHHELLAALKSGDADRLAAVLETDLDNFHQALMQTMFTNPPTNERVAAS